MLLVTPTVLQSLTKTPSPITTKLHLNTH
jgi:hypothetical protein